MEEAQPSGRTANGHAHAADDSDRKAAKKDAKREAKKERKREKEGSKRDRQRDDDDQGPSQVRSS